MSTLKVNADKMIARYRRNHQREPDLDKPLRWSEKILCRMLYQRDARFPILADKKRVKTYVEGISAANPIPTIEPQSFPYVIKPTGWSGRTRVVRNNQDLNAAYRSFDNIRDSKYATSKGEWWYWQIPFELICEPLIPVQHEVKFFCFDGRAEYIYLIDGKARSWFTREGEFLDMTDDKYPKGTDQLPDLQGALDAADKLSEDIDHVRVDLMITADGLYFGEYTFAHRSGQLRWSDPEFDRKLGEKWTLEI